MDCLLFNVGFFGGGFCLFVCCCFFFFFFLNLLFECDHSLSSQSTLSICLFVCMYACMYVCMYVHVWRECFLVMWGSINLYKYVRVVFLCEWSIYFQRGLYVCQRSAFCLYRGNVHSRKRVGGGGGGYFLGENQLGVSFS